MKLQRWMHALLPVGVLLSSALLLPGIGSAAATDQAIPVATPVTEFAVMGSGSQALMGLDATTSSTGWITTDTSTKYRLSDGSYAVGMQVIDGVYYLFDTDGNQLTGWQVVDGVRYYYQADSGAAADGVLTVDGETYLFDHTGAQKTGWRNIDGIRRYFDPETGEQVDGWIESGGYRYYADPNTGKQLGEVTIDGIRYAMDTEYGYQQLGFVTFSDNTISYYNADGSILSGWLKADVGTYYFNSSYHMVTGWQSIDAKQYYFAEDGIMKTGWQTLDGNRYYFGADGAMQTGWLTVDGAKYYFGTDGVMVTGRQTIDGKNYTFLESGKLQTVRICLDAGHYGKYNQSPVNSTYYESDMNWKLHLYLKDELESYGFEVITTRTNQATDLGLEQRGKTAEGCDLFLSIHSNATNNSTADGPLACCCVDGSMNELGQMLADLIHEVMGTRQGGSIWNRQGISGDYYGVLRGAAKVGVGGILLEHSYHTNLAATNWLLNDDNLKRMAKAEAELLARYFGLIE